MGWRGKESGSYATKLTETPIMATYTNESTGKQLIKSFTMRLGIPENGVTYDWWAVGKDSADIITGNGKPIDFYVSIKGRESSHEPVSNTVSYSGTQTTGPGTGRYPNYYQLENDDNAIHTVYFNPGVSVDPGETVKVLGTYNEKMDGKFIAIRTRKDSTNEEFVSGEVVNATYTITYNENGGTGAPASQTKTHGVDLILRTTIPTREGYNFVSWNIKPNGQDTSYQPGDVFRSNENTTLYAIWELKKYTVSYNANGGSGAPADQTKEHGKSLILSSSKPTTSKKYTVTYNANGGSVSPSSKSVSCTFDSWIANPSGVGAHFGIGEKLTSMDTSIVINDVAVDEEFDSSKHALIINYIINNGTTESIVYPCRQTAYDAYAITTITAPTGYYLQSVTLSRPWTGIVFPGWGEENDGTATFEVFSFNVDLVSSARGDALIKETINVHQLPQNRHMFAKSLPAGKYVFRISNLAGTGKQFYPGDTYNINADMELYAQWINNRAGTLATPTRDDYKFIGWFTEVEGGIQVTADTIIDFDITLYAIWEDKKCPIWVYTEDGWTHFSGTALRYDGTGWNKLEEQ